MKKYLGLDVGDRRIGVALAEDNLVAAYGAIESPTHDEAIRKIGDICRKEEITKVIIGLPMAKNTVQKDKIHQFALDLTQILNIEVEFVNEAFTSKEAERQLRGSKLDPESKKYKEEVDKMAAKFILEQYLNKTQNSKLKAQN